jgi:long-chain acyl-CoA synthetase
MSDNLARILTEAAESNPDGIAVKLDDTEVSFGALGEGSARMAGILKEKGMQPGDRVGVMLPNVPYFPIAYYGVLRAGGVVVPMNVLLKGREVAYYLKDPGAEVLFAWHGFAEAADEGAREAGAEVTASRRASSSSCSAARTRSASSSPARTTTPRSSCTRPARPASPRAPSSPTRTCTATRPWRSPRCWR